MKLYKLYIRLICAMYGIFQIYSVQTMSLRSVATNAPKIKAIQKTRKTPFVTKKIQPTLQQRLLYTPAQLKGLYIGLTENAKIVSPVHGAAKYDSGALQRMYAIENSDAPAIKLVKELFYKHGMQFKPTNLKTKAAYSLDASILGLILGALETGKFSDPTIKQNIISRWRAEHKKITDGDILKQNKVTYLADLIEVTYNEDQHAARSILLAFLYAKADPSSNHDMLHYFSSLNEYMPIFVEYSNLASEQQPVTTSPQSTLKTISNYIKSYFSNKQTYKPDEYILIGKELQQLSTHEDQLREYLLGSGFESAVSFIVNAKQKKAAFPPQVIQDYYGYKGKAKQADCVETAFRDFFNILLYDPKTQSFDLSLLPPTVILSDAFKMFYETYKTIDTINTPRAGQAFMNLVSDIPGISYNRGDYEMFPTIPNFITLINHLLGLSIETVNELGDILSDNKRTLTFSAEKTDNNRGKIYVTIQDKKSGEQQHITILFTTSHGELELAERKTKELDQGILNLKSLQSNEYRLTPQAQSLFNLQATIRNATAGPKPSSFYYALNIENDADKKSIINNIFVYNNTNNESLDYAHHLYTTLSQDDKRAIFDKALELGLHKINKNFKVAYKYLEPTTIYSKISLLKKFLQYYEHTDEEALNYAYQLYAALDEGLKEDIFDTILKFNFHKTNSKFKSSYKELHPITPWDKKGLFKTIINNYDSTNQEAFDYAYQLYASSDEASKQSLFDDILKLNFHKTNSKFKYSYKELHPADKREKQSLVKKIINNYDSTNQEAFDYAYQLYASSDEADKQRLFDDILKLNLHKTNSKFKYSYKELHPADKWDKQSLFQKIINNYDSTNQEAFDYAYTLIDDTTNKKYSLFTSDIIKSGVWKINKKFEDYILTQPIKDIVVELFVNNSMSVDNIQALYAKLSAEKQEYLLLTIIEQVHTNYLYSTKPESLSEFIPLIKTLLLSGTNLAHTNERKQGPIELLIEMKNKKKSTEDEEKIDYMIQLLTEFTTQQKQDTKQLSTQKIQSMQESTPKKVAEKKGEQKQPITPTKEAATSPQKDNNSGSLIQYWIKRVRNFWFW